MTTVDGTTNYAYDNAGQLTADGSTSYTYDQNGNRTTTGYSTGDDNQLQSDGTSRILTIRKAIARAGRGFRAARPTIIRPCTSGTIATG